MRLSSLIAVIVTTLILLTAPSAAKAQHRYFANVNPLTNHIHRCLGIGWSDGYHASGGWAVAQPQHVYPQYPSAVHAQRHVEVRQPMTQPYPQPRTTTYYAPVRYPTPKPQAPNTAQPWPSAHRQTPMARH